MCIQLFTIIHYNYHNFLLHELMRRLSFSLQHTPPRYAGEAQWNRSVRSIKADHCFCAVPTVPWLQTWVKWLNGPSLVWTEPFWDRGLTHNIFHGYHMNSPGSVSDDRHGLPANSYKSTVNGAGRPGASRVHNYHSVPEKAVHCCMCSEKITVTPKHMKRQFIATILMVSRWFNYWWAMQNR